MKLRKKVLSLFMMLLLAFNSTPVFAQDNTVKQYNYLEIEKQLVTYLNKNIKSGNTDIDKLVDDFYKSKDESALTSMFKDISKKSTKKCNTYKLANELELKFYNNGTFNVSNRDSVINKAYKSIKNASASSKNWDTGRYKIHQTHYGWFGLKLYTVSSEGRFKLDNGTLSAYVYDGDVTKYISGGFFTIRDKKTDHYTEQISGPTYRGEFSTSCEVSLGVTIKGVGYETTDNVKAYGYVITNINNGEHVCGSNIDIS